MGAVLSAGVLGSTVSDLVGAALTRRFSVADVGIDFTTIVGPTRITPEGFVLEVFGAFGTAAIVRDMTIVSVVSALRNQNRLPVPSVVMAFLQLTNHPGAPLPDLVAVGVAN